MVIGIIEKMIDAMHIGKDDIVLLNYWSEGGDGDLSSYEKALADRNIGFHTILFSDEFLNDLVNNNREGLADDWFFEYRDTTVVIDVMDRPAGMPPKGLAEDDRPALGAVLRSLFSFMSSHKKLIQITMPTRTNAVLAETDYDVYCSNMIKALDIDYEELDAACRNKVEMFKGGSILIKTGSDAELRMDISGRKWSIDAGEGAFPCGEVYIAPIEEKTNGTIYYKKFVLEGIGVFDDITLSIRNGKFVDSNCDEFNRFMESQEDKARIVGELGIGMNPAVTFSGTGAALDEDALGTFHIALGMNNLFGGKNDCRFHMDFVTEGEIIAE